MDVKTDKIDSARPLVLNVSPTDTEQTLQSPLRLQIFNYFQIKRSNFERRLSASQTEVDIAQEQIKILDSSVDETAQYAQGNEESVTPLAAHATDLRKATACFLAGSILPGEYGISFAHHLFQETVASSAHVTEDVRFSAGEVNEQYSIKEYPEGVSRWKKPHGELFFAAPLKEIVEDEHFKGFNDFTGPKEMFLEKFILQGEGGLIRKANEFGVSIPEVLSRNPSEVENKMRNGSLTPDEYVALYQLFRQCGFPYQTDQPFLELAVSERVATGSKLKLFMPQSFRERYIQELIQTYQKSKSYHGSVSQSLIAVESELAKSDTDELDQYNMQRKHVLEQLLDMTFPETEEAFIVQSLERTVFYSDDIPTGQVALYHHSHAGIAHSIFSN